MSRQYYQMIAVTDYGPYVTKLILALPEAVSGEDLSADAFSVHVTIRDWQGEVVKLPKSFIERDVFVPSQGYRPVSAAYPSTRQGERMETASPYVTLEMPYGPIWKCSAALAADFRSINGHERYTVCDYRVTQLKPVGGLNGLVFDRCAGVFHPAIDCFLQGVSSHPTQPLRYGFFIPEKLDGKKALILFLHGAGEGGDDLPIAYSGNRVTAFTEPENQAKFGGAFVLVPQCETMWLDDGSGKYGTTGRSKYTEVLKYLVDEFICRYGSCIDTDRIYIGGDSNGGFMTMRMLMSYPGFFAAAFPICEAMLDERITDADIERMKDTPIWFTHAKNDPVVVPAKYVVPTYERLMKAGAKNCHFTFWDKLIDRYAGFTDEKGEPWEYFGHLSWIPLFNDDCRLDYDGQPVTLNGEPVTLMQWLGKQKKNA